MGGKTDQTDWARLHAMTDEEAEINALADPDNRPLSAEQFAAAKIIRRALKLTQEEFSARYHIPLGTLRDWEQGRSEPDQPTRAYLRVIAVDPEGTAAALRKGAA